MTENRADDKNWATDDIQIFRLIISWVVYKKIKKHNFFED